MMAVHLGWDHAVAAGVIAATLILLGLICGYLLDELHHRK